MLYIMLSFLIGVTIVISMMLNGRLSKREGMINGIIINYLMASLSSVILCAIMIKSVSSYATIGSVPLPYFVGGLIGVLTTYIFNVIVPRMSAFYVVILRFIGQMLTSAFIDFVYLDLFSKGKIIGGILFLMGLILNARVDAKYTQKSLKLRNST